MPTLGDSSRTAAEYLKPIHLCFSRLSLNTAKTGVCCIKIYQFGEALRIYEVLKPMLISQLNLFARNDCVPLSKCMNLPPRRAYSNHSMPIGTTDADRVSGRR
jgi:hypothetical protein